MSLYYNIIFGILATEMISFLVISLPLPSKIRAPLLKMISKPFESDQVQIATKTVLVFILVLFVDAFNRSYSIDQQLKELPHAGAPFVDRSEIHAKRFYAQRNLYLTGFTLFLTLVTIRTHSLVAELIAVKSKVREGGPAKADAKILEEKIKEKNTEIENLKEKAAQLSAEYKTL